MSGLFRRYVEQMRSWIQRHWRWALPTAVVLGGMGAWLFFVYFAFQTILFDEEVDEAIPFFAAGAAPSGIEGDETTTDMADAMNEAMADDDMPMVDEVDEPMPDMPGAGTPQVPKPGVETPQPAEPAEDAEEAAPAEPAEEAAPAEETAAAEDPEPAAAEPQIVVEASGSFIDRSHPTEGIANVLGDGSGQRFLRLEDFRTDNGPDLNVYLSTAPPDAPAGAFDDDFVDLGDLKGNVGAQNYEIPVGLDLDRYSTVAIWCVRFGVVFGAAELTSG